MNPKSSENKRQKDRISGYFLKQIHDFLSHFQSGPISSLLNIWVDNTRGNIGGQELDYICILVVALSIIYYDVLSESLNLSLPHLCNGGNNT